MYINCSVILGLKFTLHVQTIPKIARMVNAALDQTIKSVLWSFSISAVGIF